MGLKIRTSAPKCSRMRAASSVRKRLNERSRNEPYSIKMRGDGSCPPRVETCRPSGYRAARIDVGKIWTGDTISLLLLRPVRGVARRHGPGHRRASGDGRIQPAEHGSRGGRAHQLRDDESRRGRPATRAADDHGDQAERRHALAPPLRSTGPGVLRREESGSLNIPCAAATPAKAPTTWISI